LENSLFFSRFPIALFSASPSCPFSPLFPPPVAPIHISSSFLPPSFFFVFSLRSGVTLSRVRFRLNPLLFSPKVPQAFRHVFFMSSATFCPLPHCVIFLASVFRKSEVVNKVRSHGFFFFFVFWVSPVFSLSLSRPRASSTLFTVLSLLLPLRVHFRFFQFLFAVDPRRLFCSPPPFLEGQLWPTSFGNWKGRLSSLLLCFLVFRFSFPPMFGSFLSHYFRSFLVDQASRHFPWSLGCLLPPLGRMEGLVLLYFPA